MSRWQPISPWKLGKCQTVAIGATHAESTAQVAPYQAVLVRATADCHILTGVSAAASATDTLIKASDPPLVLALQPGEVVSVIEDSATGTLFVTPLTH